MLVYKIIKTDAIDAQTVDIYKVKSSGYYSIDSFLSEINRIDLERHRGTSKIYHQLNYK